MRVAAIALTSALVVAAGSFGDVKAKADAPLPVPGYPAATDLPGEHEVPDPTMDYRVVFADGQEAKPGEINPMLPMIARYVNTLAAHGVPASKRHIIVMFHQRNPDMDIVMTNEAYKARHHRDNPNIALLHALKEAGVELRACGQGVLGRKIDPKDVNPDIQIDLWALTSLVNLQLKGYVRVG